MEEEELNKVIKDKFAEYGTITSMMTKINV